MPFASKAEFYFILAMMILILVICAVAIYFFFVTYKKEMHEKAERQHKKESEVAGKIAETQEVETINATSEFITKE